MLYIICYILGQVSRRWNGNIAARTPIKFSDTGCGYPKRSSTAMPNIPMLSLCITHSRLTVWDRDRIGVITDQI